MLQDRLFQILDGVVESGAVGSLWLTLYDVANTIISGRSQNGITEQIAASTSIYRAVRSVDVTASGRADWDIDGVIVATEGFEPLASFSDGICKGFTDDAINMIASTGILVKTSTGPDGQVEIVQGDDYMDLRISEPYIDSWGDLTDNTYMLGLFCNGATLVIDADANAIATYGDGRRYVTFALTAMQTTFQGISDWVNNGKVQAAAISPEGARKTLVRPNAPLRVLKSVLPV